MYKLIKDAGQFQNVIVKNTETNAEVIIGRISPAIIRILDEHDLLPLPHDEDDHTTTFTMKWSLDITDDVSKELQKLALRMKKPIRHKTEKPTEPPKNNKDIDAMDVLLGLAHYN